MVNYAIEVKNISVSYKTFKSFSIKNQFFKGNFKRVKTYEAVKNLTFSLEKGEILGLVGGNGAGKSTTLKVIAGIFSPNKGTIDLHGNSVSLLSVGMGFQVELTGRENIVMTGMLMGFSEKDVKERMKSIIEFAELGEFIDLPVKTYSSGMRSKLSFAIAVILEPDILLVDELLSVGDLKFRRKSFNKMKDIIRNKNRTVIIVTHNSLTIRNLCSKVLWLEKGEIKMFGEVKKVMEAYDSFVNEQI